MSRAASITWPSNSAGKRLFVAELGNGTVDVVDLQAGKSVGRVSNLREPQGVAYILEQDLIVVASAGDGSVRFYRAADLKPVTTVALGDDADNIRIDPTTGNIIVGYGNGGLAIIDPKTRSKVGDIRLPGHPEAFQVDPRTHRAFVNVPDAHQVVVVDIDAEKQTEAWKTSGPIFRWPLARQASHLPRSSAALRRSPFWIRRPALSQRGSACAATRTMCSSTRSEAGST